MGALYILKSAYVTAQTDQSPTFHVLDRWLMRKRKILIRLRSLI